MLGVTGNSPSSCLRHVTGGGLSLHFFFGAGGGKQLYQIGICSALRQLPQPAVQELSCDEGTVPRDASGERSGWQEHRHSACHR